MKWEDTDDDKAHKSAFLRTLMLQVYATLFAQGLVPNSIKWSYPSAMAGQLLYSYQSIWETLKTISPVLKENGERYELNVSCYTDTRSLGTDIGTGAFGTVGQTSTGSESGFGGGFGGGFGSQDSSFEGGFGSNGSSGFSMHKGHSVCSDWCCISCHSH